MRRLCKRRLRFALAPGLARQEGQALVEYALILGMIALLTIGVLQSLGQSMSGLLNQVSSNMTSVMNP